MLLGLYCTYMFALVSYKITSTVSCYGHESMNSLFWREIRMTNSFSRIEMIDTGEVF